MPTAAVADRLGLLEPAEPQGPPFLKIIPLLGPSHEDPPYRLLQGEVLEKVRVTEASEDGSVPELVVHNDLRERVFLMDGQELVGAKQNRILNTDVLVPAQSRIPIPVSCVEQGRWSYRSAQFQPGKAASFATRRRKLDRVHRSLREDRGHDADQGAIWEEVAESLASVKVNSETSALADAYAARQKELDHLRGSLTLPENAVGLAVFAGDTFQGLDLFDRHATLLYFWQSLVDSYGLDAVGRRAEVADAGERSSSELGQALKEAAAGDWETFPSPGEGDDLRLEHGRYSGSALAWNDQSVLHLQLFPRQEIPHSEATEEHRQRPRLHRRSLRRPPAR